MDVSGKEENQEDDHDVDEDEVDEVGVGVFPSAFFLLSLSLFFAAVMSCGEASRRNFHNKE